MRCFVAVELGREVRERLAGVQQKLPRGNLKFVAPQNMHITLKFLGEADEVKLREVERRLERVEGAPFAVRVRGVGAFPNERYPRVVWAGCEGDGLGLLTGKIGDALAGMGFDEEKFSGHITLARVKGDVELAGFFEENRGIELGELAVRGFELKKSVLGREGPAYGTIRRFELRG